MKKVLVQLPIDRIHKGTIYTAGLTEVPQELADLLGLETIEPISEEEVNSGAEGQKTNSKLNPTKK
jgi:hypothetical protein